MNNNIILEDVILYLTKTTQKQFVKNVVRPYCSRWN